MAKDMTTGKPFQTLFLFAVPMVLGNVFQQLYNIVDSMVVGNYVSADALAAVGASTAITSLFIAVAIGAGIGCSVVISQLFGANKLSKMKTAIYTSLISMFTISLIVMLIGIWGNRLFLKLLHTPINIFEDAVSYLNIYFWGISFLFLFNTLNSIFNALGDSKIPLFFLAMASIINIFLDLLFVIHYEMGVAGVAWGTLIAQGISAMLSFAVLLFRLRSMETEENEEERIFDLSLLKGMSHIAGPSILQQSVVSFGMLCVQGLVNRYGSVVVAGFTAATKIDTIAIMPMVNVGNAVSTFTAQNLGAQKKDRIPKGFRAGQGMSAAIALTITLILFLAGEQLVGAFVDTAANGDVIAVGVEYLRVVSIFYVLFGFMNICNGVLRGAGDMRIFMISTMINFIVRVAAAYSLSPIPTFGEKAIWWAIPMGWVIGTAISFTRYAGGKWKEKEMVVK